MTFQTTYSTRPAAARAGQVADISVKKIDSCIAETAVGVALAVVRGDGDQSVKAITDVTADTDSIVSTAVAAATSRVNFSGATLNGVIGQGAIVPAQQITVALNSHAHWTGGEITLVMEDVYGRRFTETFDVPSGGNTTLTSAAVASKVISGSIDPQGGTSATLTIGTTPSAAEFSPRTIRGVALLDNTREPYAENDYDQYDSVPVISSGRVYVTSETAVADGDPVYVRIVTSGADVNGQFRSSSSSSFALWPGAKFVSTADADGVAIIEF